MVLDPVWATFIDNIYQAPSIDDVKKTHMAGTPFLYVSVNDEIEHKEMQKIIESAAVQSMKGKRLHFEAIFVRKDQHCYVYRCRFYVPQEKMFCCGNFCHDCIRFNT